MKLLKQSKLLLCALTVSAVSALSMAQTWSAYANYDNGVRSASAYNYVAANGSGFNASLSGVGAGGGVAFVLDTTNNQYICYATGGNGPGLPISFTDSTASSPSDGRTLVIVNGLSLSSPGAYATSSVSQTW